jgi:hypothetical protein
MALLQIAPVQAKPKEETRATEARKDCLSGKYELGITILAELFAETKQSTYVYNQARCYEQNGRPADAINRFREYLRIEKNISPGDKAEVDRHIAECQDVRSEQEKQVAAASAPVPALSASPAHASAPSFPATDPSLAARALPAPGALDLTAKPGPLPTDVPGERRPFYATWWFWTGTAAVVAAGTVTAILIAGHSSGPCDGASLTCQGVK